MPKSNPLGGALSVDGVTGRFIEELEKEEALQAIVGE